MPPGASPRRGRHAHTYADGSTYTGDFVDGLRHGQGTYTWADGGRYEGQWHEGKKHGQGEYFFKASESTFMGRWSEGAFEEGEWVFSDGSSYRGPFADGKPTGEGTYTNDAPHKGHVTYVLASFSAPVRSVTYTMTGIDIDGCTRVSGTLIQETENEYTETFTRHAQGSKPITYTMRRA